MNTCSEFNQSELPCNCELVTPSPNGFPVTIGNVNDQLQFKSLVPGPGIEIISSPTELLIQRAVTPVFFGTILSSNLDINPGGTFYIPFSLLINTFGTDITISNFSGGTRFTVNTPGTFDISFVLGISPVFSTGEGNVSLNLNNIPFARMTVNPGTLSYTLFLKNYLNAGDFFDVTFTETVAGVVRSWSEESTTISFLRV